MTPLLPENGKRGGLWHDHREVWNGILWKPRNGAAPGMPATISFVRWRRDGAPERSR